MAEYDIRLEQAANKAEIASEQLHEFVNGPDTGTISTESGPLPTIAKFIADEKAIVEAQVAEAAADIAQAVVDAQAAQTAAESARDAAQLSAGVYADTTAGLAATTNGQYFSVPSADSAEYLILYKNNLGAAVEQKRYPAMSFFDTNLQSNLHEASNVPLVVDESGNVAVWLANGLLGAVGFDSTAVEAIRSQLSGSLVQATAETWPPFAIYSETDGRVVFVIDGDGECYFYGLTPNAAQSSQATPSAVLATGGESLYGWRARIASAIGGSGIAKIILTGDSWAENSAPIPTPLSQALYAEYGQSGNGWVSVHADESGSLSQLLNGATLVKSAGWTLLDMDAAECKSLDGYAVSATGTSATVTISALKTQSLKWYYNDGTGTFRYTVDGGAPTTVVCGNTGAMQSLTISGLSDANHSIVFDLTGNAGTVVFYGGYATRTAAGIEFSKAGNGGSTGDQWYGIATHLQSYATDISPDVVVVVLGTNDSRQLKSKSSVKAGVLAIVNAYRAGAANCAVLLVAPPSGGETTSPALLAEYRDAMYEIAASTDGVEFMNLHDFMPGYSVMNAYGVWGDLNHLNASGGRYVTGLLMKHFLKTN